MFKQEKGVTLVALVITIIVLLILAGVSISMVAGDNGVLTKASKSSLKTKYGAAVEAVNLACADLQSDYADEFSEGKANSPVSYYTVYKMVKALDTQGYVIEGVDAPGEGETAYGTEYKVLTAGTSEGSPVLFHVGATEDASTSNIPYYRVYAKGANKDYIEVRFIEKTMGFSADYKDTLGTTKVK